MTTPIKQLQDENDNSFYPQTAKAAIADLLPIQTADIANGAVISGKIDFSTITNGPSAMPVATRSIASGYGTYFALKRIGNLVHVDEYTVNNNSIPAGTTNLTETVPYGYRPKGVTVVIGVKADGDTSGPGVVSWKLSPTGSMTISSYPTGNGQARWLIHGFYFTEDDFPTSDIES